MMTPEKQRNENAILVTEKKLVTGDDNNDISLSTIRFFGYGFAFGKTAISIISFQMLLI